ncbi:zinc-dependent MarR family transcriptional regulator [Streptococcus plurextorum]|uniref:zinc-dependent MarR family transcriptional regulator n=1 Tax=Streptococcus plurextorum TaxID=456876 RepID=UPI000408011D|nr:zinc-dependent MarR family transcriptional regulator [Streptococcus plurextorum]
MKILAKEIDTLVSKILLKAENHNELLIGSCQSPIQLTNTQEHILMLLSQENLTNTDLAKRLKVSQAAVTKAVKGLIQKGLLESSKKTEDGRSLHLTLTEQAHPIAEEHHHHHVKTLAVYEQVLEEFSTSEKAIISRFVAAFERELEK